MGIHDSPLALLLAVVSVVLTVLSIPRERRALPLARYATLNLTLADLTETG